MSIKNQLILGRKEDREAVENVLKKTYSCMDQRKSKIDSAGTLLVGVVFRDVFLVRVLFSNVCVLALGKIPWFGVFG